MPNPAAMLRPRKTPVQARSVHTVDAILQASVQVLLAGGLDRLTTTRVAERAGVSVGTLYQYFPNKRALMATVLERHLEGVVDAVEAACARAHGQTTGRIAAALVEAFVAAKLSERDASIALHAIAPEIGGEALVQRLSRRAQRTIAATLSGACGPVPRDPALAAYLVSTALIGPVQGLLASRARAAQARVVTAELVAMIAAYLRSVATR